MSNGDLPTISVYKFRLSASRVKKKEFKHTSSHSQSSEQLPGTILPTIFAKPPLREPTDFAKAWPYFIYSSFLPGWKARRFSIDTALLGRSSLMIQSRNSWLNSSLCVDSAILGRVSEPVKGIISLVIGCKRWSFLASKELISLDGMPAWIDQDLRIMGWSSGGSRIGSLWMISIRCQEVAESSKLCFESWVGLMIHLTARAMIRGLSELCLSFDTTTGIDVSKIVQIGILR